MKYWTIPQHDDILEIKFIKSTLPPVACFSNLTRWISKASFINYITLKID